MIGDEDVDLKIQNRSNGHQADQRYSTDKRLSYMDFKNGHHQAADRHHSLQGNQVLRKADYTES